MQRPHACLRASAVARAALGQHREARDALAVLEQTFERLPSDITREQMAAGWPEERLHHCRSEAAAFGGISGGEAAREAALDLYPRAEWRSRVQITLHRAAAEADPRYAAHVLGRLTPAQRKDHGIRLIALRVLDAAGPRAAGAAGLREALAS
jgi:hypothetical protein